MQSGAAMLRTNVLALMLVPSCAFLAPFAPPRALGARMMIYPAGRAVRLSEFQLRRPPAPIMCLAASPKPSLEDNADGFVWPDEHEEEESGDEWMDPSAWGEGPEDYVLEARVGPCDEIPLEKCSFVPKTKAGAPSEEGAVTIRAFKGWELPAVDRHRCFRLLKDNMQGMYEESTWSWDADSKQKDLESHHARFLVATQDGANGVGGSNVIGFVNYRYELLEDAVDAPTYGALYIHELQMTASAQGKGVGSALMDMELAARRRMDKIMLCVFHDINPRAHAWYQARGFIPVQSNSIVAAATCTTEMSRAVVASGAVASV
ncbi:hypothetical protein T484DRAFT_2280797 [Baffinella frigidus]|nr:hypothetical protein T484DRAFT_2280797 [Cryptophyta sp. CCMP2293]